MSEIIIYDTPKSAATVSYQYCDRLFDREHFISLALVGSITLIPYVCLALMGFRILRGSQFAKGLGKPFLIFGLITLLSYVPIPLGGWGKYDFLIHSVYMAICVIQGLFFVRICRTIAPHDRASQTVTS